ncbi:hypothetical protein NQ176_g2377 [Zarea fungicola]|uniref:Uncharacterized protein n=1 Tax=Zarea fungicola TaxID=93591 RepID=A0ACC1NPY9_9HYPO|nr:hypothetical protein NQ176_g2377 [Lecanicillium fungicola]
MYKAGIALLLASLSAPAALAAAIVTSCSASNQIDVFGVTIGNEFRITINGVSDPNNNLCGKISADLILETSADHFNPPINLNDVLSCSTTKQPDPFKTAFLSIILDKHSPSDQLSAFKSAMFDAFNNDPAFGGHLPDFNCDLSRTIP